MRLPASQVRRAFDVHFGEQSPQAYKTRKFGTYMEAQKRKALWGSSQAAVGAVLRLGAVGAMMTPN